MQIKSEIRISMQCLPSVQIEGEAVTVVLGSVGKSGERKVISHTSFTSTKNMFPLPPCSLMFVQVTRVLPGGEVEARVISGRQLFISITNSSTNCSFLVNTSAHHGDFVRSRLQKNWFDSHSPRRWSTRSTRRSPSAQKETSWHTQLRLCQRDMMMTIVEGCHKLGNKSPFISCKMVKIDDYPPSFEVNLVSSKQAF